MLLQVSVLEDCLFWPHNLVHLGNFEVKGRLSYLVVHIIYYGFIEGFQSLVPTVISVTLVPNYALSSPPVHLHDGQHHLGGEMKDVRSSYWLYSQISVRNL